MSYRVMDNGVVEWTEASRPPSYIPPDTANLDYGTYRNWADQQPAPLVSVGVEVKLPPVLPRL